jgi:hypothetical protein
VNRKPINELREAGIQKEAVIIESCYYLGIILVGMRKTTNTSVRIVCVKAGIRT